MTTQSTCLDRLVDLEHGRFPTHSGTHTQSGHVDQRTCPEGHCSGHVLRRPIPECGSATDMFSGGGSSPSGLVGPDASVQRTHPYVTVRRAGLLPPTPRRMSPRMGVLGVGLRPTTFCYPWGQGAYPRCLTPVGGQILPPLWPATWRMSVDLLQNGVWVDATDGAEECGLAVYSPCTSASMAGPPKSVRAIQSRSRHARLRRWRLWRRLRRGLRPHTQIFFVTNFPVGFTMSGSTKVSLLIAALLAGLAAGVVLHRRQS
jgi:hypothetical protein